MRILFTHSYFLYLDTKQVAHSMPYPPLGTIWAASLLRTSGYEVALHDVMFATGPECLQESLLSFRPDVLVIYDDGFNYLTKMCLTNMRQAAFEMQQLAAASGCTVIASGSDATDHYSEYLDNGAHYVILGEAEYTLLELVKYLEQEEVPAASIQGIGYKLNGVNTATARRAVINNLDELPLPAWDLVDIAPYKEAWMRKHGYFSINIATTRGCPYKCNWCAKPIYGNAYHMRSPENVVKEMIWLKKLFQMDHIWFCDDIFGLKRSWVATFAALVQKEDIITGYKIQSRADLLVKEHYVADLAASGCMDVWMGAESGSQKILDAMDKGTSLDQIIEARKLLKKHGIRASFFIQYGYPGEKREDIERTLSLIKTTLPDDIGISVSYPLPGTAFYEKVKNQLQGKHNWKDSDDLDMMFSNTYPKEFYKYLHRYTHFFYRLEKIKKQTVFSVNRNLRYIKYFMLKRKYQQYLNQIYDVN